MTEMIKISIEEFSRLQRFMMLADKESDVYKAMYERYNDLKAILTAAGVNIESKHKIKFKPISKGVKSIELLRLYTFYFCILCLIVILITPSSDLNGHILC